MGSSELHYTEWIRQGKEAEEEGDLEVAAGHYEHAIAQHPMEVWPYQRLMVLYRKLGQTKDEIRVVEQALKLFQAFYDERPEKLLNHNKRLRQMSSQLLRALGGKQKPTVYYPEPIPAWQRRQAALIKKLKKKK